MLYIFVIENAGPSVDSITQNRKPNASVTCELPKTKKYDPTIDERLPETVTLLTTPDGGKLYLVGTAHFSVESQNDVSKVTKLRHFLPHLLSFTLFCTFYFILPIIFKKAWLIKDYLKRLDI